MSKLARLDELGPREAAERVYAAHATERGWLDAFAEYLDRRRAGRSLARTLAVWGLSQADAARLFGVSRQAVGKWLQQGAPAARAESIADLAAATDFLVRYLQRDRIPAVVRRPIPARAGRSLLELAQRGQTREVLATCREMFSFEQAHG